jgi:hypothetical protein
LFAVLTGTLLGIHDDDVDRLFPHVILILQVASASPRKGQKMIKPSKHVFDGFSYLIESLFSNISNLSLKALGINNPDLRKQHARFTTIHDPYRGTQRVTFRRRCKGNNEARLSAQPLQNQNGPIVLCARTILLKTNVYTNGAPPNLSLVIKWCCLRIVQLFFLFTPAVKILFHITEK